MKQKFQRILGINFFTGDTPELLTLCSQGHFIVAPAAPALAELPTNPIYRESVEKSDFAITDSSFMVLLWLLLSGQSLRRISGVELLRSLLASDELRDAGNSAWIMPSEREKEINLAWLNRNGIPVTVEQCYVAPHYAKGEISDLELLVWIETHKPKYVIINIGGGIQEPLGLYLKENLFYQPSIICVGAAIALLSGIQAKIPTWADKCMLGWLYRCLHAPSKFVPRYRGALRLVPILAKYRERSVATYVPDLDATLSQK
jgi:N-acetylglucosaminyldiphosphoundecaprenol N-acetyl-beta-D-mannosaminyltransferase